MSLTKLKVDQLRSELLARDLDTSGTKPVLLARLQEAIAAAQTAAQTAAPAPADAASAPAPAPAPAKPADADAAPAPAHAEDNKPKAAALKNFKDLTDAERILARKARFGGTDEGMFLSRAVRFGGGGDKAVGRVVGDVAVAVAGKREHVDVAVEDKDEIARREKRAKRFT